jgi:hypothetical protein
MDHSWNVDGWYTTKAVAEDMAAWYRRMNKYNVHVISDGGQYAVLYGGTPYTGWHSKPGT